MTWPLIVVAETAAYLAWTRKVLDEDERDEIVVLLAEGPNLTPSETNALRKLVGALVARHTERAR